MLNYLMGQVAVPLEPPIKPEEIENTAFRMLDAFTEFTYGYRCATSEIEKCLIPFDNIKTSTTAGSFVIIADIEFSSLCKHHLMPFFGKIHVCYSPTDKIVGLSKIPRCVNLLSRRLQLQESLGLEITETIYNSKLQPAGVGCIIEASHTCVGCRGVMKQNSKMITNHAIGCLEERDNSLWEEFSAAVNRSRI